MTRREWLAQAADRLARQGFEAARLEAELLLCFAEGRSGDRAWLIAHDLEPPTPAADPLLERRARHEPLAYILGTREFFGRSFRVGPGVLIPRHETEILVELALDLIDLHGVGRVLDLGTGSGCIAITLAAERPVSVTGVDISRAALEIARLNDTLGTVHWIEHDGIPARSFDLVVSNPPYISVHEKLSREVSEYEPAEALFAGDDALGFYKRIAEAATGCKRVAVEIGRGQHDAVAAIFAQQGWRLEQSRRDLSKVIRALAFYLP
ncbi:MAG: peptide chain release factor N(5)-glutamine methyltransferase [Chthonomonas sp.]|nr:peptide chain release factor N(5)-glutamine methyltransferase [Chthonomonas sp.]